MGLPPYERLFQDTGVTYYWLYGSGDGNSLMINDIDISTTAVFPNFLGGTGPLRVRPGFTFTLLDGPSYPVLIDLPGALQRLPGLHLEPLVHTPIGSRVGGETGCLQRLYDGHVRFGPHPVVGGRRGPLDAHDFRQTRGGLHRSQ